MLAQGRDKCKCEITVKQLFAVRYPDIFYLGGMLQEPATFRLFGIEPIDRTALIGSELLQIYGGHSLRSSNHGFVSVAPQAVYVIVFGDGFQKLRGVTAHDIDRAAGHIT